jgi:hypothetical protein
MAMDIEVKVKVKVIDLIEEECTYSDYLNPKICVEMMSQCFDAIFYRRDLVPNRTLSQKATEAFYECSSIEQ